MGITIGEIPCILIGILISAALNCCFGIIAEKYNIGLLRIFNKAPGWMGIVIILLILLCVPALYYQFEWGYVAYTYLIEDNLLFAFLAFGLNALAALYTSLVGGDFAKRFRR